jgi:predicted methyltransferase
MRAHFLASLAALLMATALSASGPARSATGASDASASAVDPAIRAAIDSPDRPDADKQRDAGRRPAVLLQFCGIRSGQVLIEYYATGGNTAELLARVVAPKGRVFMQNPPSFYQRPAGPNGVTPTQMVEQRLASERLPNVVRLDRPFEALGLPPASIDGAVMNLVFHDMFYMADVPSVLANLYSTLKPGGFVCVEDHSAPSGTGASYALKRDGQHRIDEDYAKTLFAAAGFELAKESDALRNPADDRQKAFFAPEMRGKLTDRFLVLFRKPAKPKKS